MSDRAAAPAVRHRISALILALGCALLASVVLAVPAAAEPSHGPGAAVLAFPVTPAEQAPAEDNGCGNDDFCIIGDFLFGWIGDAAGEVASDAWTSAMMAIWAAGLWVLGLAFSVIDAFTTPDLSADGPLAQVYPITFGIGAALVVLMALIQLGAAAVRRDGTSLGKLAIGIGQFGLVWAGYVGTLTLLVTGVSGLTNGLLQALLGIDAFASFDATSGWPDQITDPVVATILGVSAIFLLFPASAAYLLLMMVREAALMLLAATSAITAGGLTAETSSAWFWKSLRWFIAALLIAPMAVLVLGIGVKITEGAVVLTDDVATEVATAVIGCLLILVGAVCPVILFKLLAFVDPGTTSGVAMRQSLAASGGVTGLLSSKLSGDKAGGAGATSGAGSGASTKVDGGRAQGESTADAATQGRFGAVRAALASGARRLDAGSDKLGQLASGAAAAGSDVLAGAGVGHQAPYYGQSGSARPPGTSGAGGSSAQFEPPPWGGGYGDPPYEPPPSAPPPPVSPRPPESPSGDAARYPTTPQPVYRAEPVSAPSWKGAAVERHAGDHSRTGGRG